MSRGKRGTCNYKMYTFRISLTNLKFIEWLTKNNLRTKGQNLNDMINFYKLRNPGYHEEETIDPRQTIIEFT